ncbi:uncharacterized protein DNG_09361 [Cephalotrichum gorgonifer]|uniref:Uncharacterized protein n=1 Tax=Cephalotrichum gorgonifer TaxID=2041049 RepID=A0AAE8N6R5_9PEZI|nr:uncharacterized protein DNG_09361 [Cephalotrichum gorgonifer]
MESVQSPNPTKERLLQQDSSSDNIGTAKPEADNQEAEGKGPAGAVQGQRPLRRYWIRALVAIAIPTIITVYYGIIWVWLVQGTTIDEAVKYNTYSGSLIFYSWFIIGVFALSWAKFGLIGVESSMLHTPFWHAPNMVVLLMHADSTWSSPSGWLKAIKHREFHRLWVLLTFTSVLPFIAMPLSGLVFEITDGYISTSEIPLVQGRNQTTFNKKYEQAMAVKPPESAWLLGYPPSIPGIGIIYTDKSVDRSEHDDLKKLPNTLPVAESIPDLFLPPQAEKPVSGRTWGLRIKYDCSVVQSASEFTILSQKPASSIWSLCNEEFDGTKCIDLKTPSGDYISMRNATLLSGNPINVGAYFEVGTSAIPRYKLYDGDDPDFEADEGDNSFVFEYAAWQYHSNGSYHEDTSFFNETVGSTIEGIGSPFIESDGKTYTVNHTFFALKGDIVDGSLYPNRTSDASELMELETIFDGFYNVLLLAPPVGVRCVASSGLGTAELDGVTSTFRNFQRVDPKQADAGFTAGSQRFGLSAADILHDRFHELYIAGGLPGLEGVSNSNRLPGFVTSDGLLRAVNLAYAVDAFDLIYSITSSFKAPWPEPGLTTSREGRILAIASLIPGSAVGYLVLALFCIWAALSVGLSLWYGFRMRPSERLDGYTMLWKGVEMADDLKDNEELIKRKSFHGSKALAALPGR